MKKEEIPERKKKEEESLSKSEERRKKVWKYNRKENENMKCILAKTENESRKYLW
jgi:hypothetical protein